MNTPFRAGLLLLTLVVGAPFGAVAESPRTPPPAAAENHASPHLPAPSVTQHVLDLPGRTLRFTARAEAITIPDQDGAPAVEIATIAYTLDGTKPASRPVVFAINGGPGFSSAFLQLGALGPWRVPMDDVPSSPPLPQPNADTWLDFADLVFIDPVETGDSRVVSSDRAIRKTVLSVKGDVDYLAQVIRRWLETNHRLLSPKFITGESYGGFRAPLIARVLQSEQGVGVDGLVMISPMLDTGGRSSAFDPLRPVELLPSLAAVARSGKGKLSEASLADVEAYATGEYLQDLLKVARDPAALDRVTAKVTALTGLEPELVRRLKGRIDASTFLRNHEPGRIGSGFDATISDPQASDGEPWFGEPEPITSRLGAPFTGAMTQIYEWLNWHPTTLYRLHDPTVGREWDWGGGHNGVEAVTSMRRDLAVDSRMRVLVAHGLYDLVTPYFATKLILESIPDIGAPGRIRLLCLPAGHMVYARDEPRRALRDAVQALISAGE